MLPANPARRNGSALFPKTSPLLFTVSFLLSLLLSPIVLAIQSTPPYTSEDLVSFGREPQFRGVHVLSQMNSRSFCSAVPVDLGSHDGENQMYFTAGHCIKDRLLTYYLNGKNVTHLFPHPSYLAGSKEKDIGAFTSSSEQNEGYKIFSGDPYGLVGKTLFHVGFGRMTGTAGETNQPRQAMAVTITQFNGCQFIVSYKENTEASSSRFVKGWLSSGDSGGGLFVADEGFKTLQLVGIASRGGILRGIWSYIDPLFVELAKKGLLLQN